MPTEVTRWQCNDCGRLYQSHAAAEACEHHHAEKLAALSAECAQYFCGHPRHQSSALVACSADCEFCDRGPRACHFSMLMPASTAGKGQP